MKRFKIPVLGVIVFMLFLSSAAISTAATPSAININTAPAEELAKLDRIGPKYAQRIIDYRENIAPFALPEDIMKVKGIGIRTYEANKDIIVVK